MSAELGIIVAGAAGRMGSTIIRLVAADTALRLVGACESPQSSSLGLDAGSSAGVREMGIKISADLATVLKKAQGVIIDFSTVTATLANLQQAVQAKVPMVIGTTGFDPAQMQLLRDAAKTIPVMQAPNMSVGVNMLFKTVGEAARILGEGYDIEIFEAHHRNKTDAPSGTALKLAEKICDATDRKYPDDLNLRQMGVIGKRSDREIGMQVMRGGDIVGDHTVFFCGEGERVEIRHIATDRSTFAAGSIRAAKWLQQQPAGLYDMHDVLGLK